MVNIRNLQDATKAVQYHGGVLQLQVGILQVSLRHAQAVEDMLRPKYEEQGWMVVGLDLLQSFARVFVDLEDARGFLEGISRRLAMGRRLKGLPGQLAHIGRLIMNTENAELGACYFRRHANTPLPHLSFPQETHALGQKIRELGNALNLNRAADPALPDRVREVRADIRKFASRRINVFGLPQHDLGEDPAFGQEQAVGLDPAVDPAIDPAIEPAVDPPVAVD